MPGKTPPLRHDADGAALPFPVADANPHSPRPPPFACLPREHHADAADARADPRLEHDRRIADAIPRAPWGLSDEEFHRPEPIPRSEHYRENADARFRTTAIPPVTHRHVGHTRGTLIKDVLISGDRGWAAIQTHAKSA